MFPEKTETLNSKSRFTTRRRSYTGHQLVARVWEDTPDPDISFHNTYIEFRCFLFSRNSSGNSSHALQTNWLVVIVLVLDKTHAFRFSRNLYIDMSFVYQEKLHFAE